MSKTIFPLERPYKTHEGDHLPVLQDITEDGEFMWEEHSSAAKELGSQIHRLYTERSQDLYNNQDITVDSPTSESSSSEADDDMTDAEPTTALAVTREQREELRKSLIENLQITLGEMCQARDLFSVLLSSGPIPKPFPPELESFPPSALSTEAIEKPPPLHSIQAFDEQLCTSQKDDALRNATILFRTAAESMERTAAQAHGFWATALSLRNENWSVSPDSHTIGMPLLKGTDRVCKDFSISYGLELSPPIFRSLSTAKLPSHESSSKELMYASRQKSQLVILMAGIMPGKGTCRGRSSSSLLHDGMSTAGQSPSYRASLHEAQRKIIDREIFTTLVSESERMTTASVRILESSLAVEIAPGWEVQFTMIDEAGQNPARSTDISVMCDAIYSLVVLLLLKTHAFKKRSRSLLSQANHSTRPNIALPLILRPVIDFLQFQVFYHRVLEELSRVKTSLHIAGIPCHYRMTSVSDNGQQIAQLLEVDDGFKLGGEVILRVNKRQTIRLTIALPSTLIAHLPLSTSAVTSTAQLRQILSDEIQRGLLLQISAIGTKMSQNRESAWFTDPLVDKVIGRWEGCVLTFQLGISSNWSVLCQANYTAHDPLREKTVKFMARQEQSLTSWIEAIIKEALNE